MQVSQSVSCLCIELLPYRLPKTMSKARCALLFGVDAANCEEQLLTAAAAAAESGDASKVPDSAPSTASGVAPCAAGVKVTAMADAPDDPADGDQSEAVELEVGAADDLLGEDEHEEEFDEAAHDTAVDVD